MQLKRFSETSGHCSRGRRESRALDGFQWLVSLEVPESDKLRGAFCRVAE